MSKKCTQNAGKRREGREEGMKRREHNAELEFAEGLHFFETLYSQHTWRRKNTGKMRGACTKH